MVYKKYDCGTYDFAERKAKQDTSENRVRFYVVVR